VEWHAGGRRVEKRCGDGVGGRREEGDAAHTRSGIAAAGVLVEPRSQDCNSEPSPKLMTGTMHAIY